MTIIPGGLRPSAFVFRAISLRVPVTVLCNSVVPHWITAAGVPGDLPFLIRFSAITGRVVIPINITIVSTPVAILSHAMELLLLIVSSCPVMKAIVDEEHTSELQSRLHLVCRLLLEKKKNK